MRCDSTSVISSMANTASTTDTQSDSTTAPSNRWYNSLSTMGWGASAWGHVLIGQYLYLISHIRHQLYQLLHRLVRMLTNIVYSQIIEEVSAFENGPDCLLLLNLESLVCYGGCQGVVVGCFIPPSPNNCTFTLRKLGRHTAEIIAQLHYFCWRGEENMSVRYG